MAKRKVLIAVHQLNIGGVQKALISALNAIDYEQNEVTLYVRKARTDLIPLVNKNVCRIIVNDDRTKYYRKPKPVWYLLRLYSAKLLHKDTKKIKAKLDEYVISQQMEYEKEHYFSGDYEYDVAVSYIQSHTAKLVCDSVKAKKKVMFYHGSTDEFHDINASVMKMIDKVYCVSKGSMEAIKGFYPQFADKMDYVENFVDYKKIREDATLFDPQYEKDKLILCSCGRMTNVKGFDLAVKAAKILKDANLDFKWYFVGDGVERANIENLISNNGLNDNIMITGLVENPYSYTKNCDIYVQPSYEESYGLAIIEAMIVGVPVVSTATVGGNEVVADGKTGLIADIDEKSIADKIIYLLNNKELQDSIKQNLEKKDYEEDNRVFREKWKMLLEE